MKSQLQTPRSLFSPGPLRAGASNDRKRWPWMLLAALVLVALTVPLWDDFSTPNSLDEVALVGDRGPGCVRVVVANDQSGSMIAFARPREQALAQLVEWIPQNLRSDDELAVLAFTDHVETVLAPTVATGRPPVGSLSMPGNDTLLEPVLSTVARLPRSYCRTVLMLLSDGVMSDLPNSAPTARIEILAAGIDELHLLVPGEKIDIDPQWPEIYPYAAPVRFDGNDPSKTGLVLGEVLAAVTDQHLDKKPE
ncbi:MAG: hypothetical protein V7697_28980 [Rhodococcus erythropolis]